MYKLYCRIFQNVLKVFSYFLPWRKPDLLEGINCIQSLPKIIKRSGINKVFIVTGPNVTALGLGFSIH